MQPLSSKNMQEEPDNEEVPELNKDRGEAGKIRSTGVAKSDTLLKAKFTVGADSNKNAAKPPMKKSVFPSNQSGKMDRVQYSNDDLLLEGDNADEPMLK